MDDSTCLLQAMLQLSVNPLQSANNPGCNPLTSYSNYISTEACGSLVGDMDLSLVADQNVMLYNYCSHAKCSGACCFHIVVEDTVR